MVDEARKPPRVSVVVPTCNRADYIAQTLDSILAQTFREFEVIVVDDGSTDPTSRVLERYRGAVRYVRQANRGEAAARNRGVAEARGEWIAFLDSDDLWKPETLETLMEVALRHPEAGLLAMGGRRIRADGTPSGEKLRKRTRGPYFSTAGLLLRDMGSVLMPVVRRTALIEVGGFDESFTACPDYDMWLRLSFRTRMLHVPEPLMMRRVHEGNLTADDALIARMTLRAMDKLAREQPAFVTSHPRVYRQALARQHQRLGRGLLASYGGRAEELAEARRELRTSLGYWPWSLRCWRRFLWSLVAPKLYRGWRNRELRRREVGDR